jgi:hypothetical protein
MCFIKEWEVDDLEDPLYEYALSADAKMLQAQKVLHASEQGQDNLKYSAMSALALCAKISIHNSVATEALKQSIYKERVRLDDEIDVGLFPSDTVVITDPYSFHKSLYLKSLPEDRVWVSMDARLNGLVLAFQLNDFSCIVKYAVKKIPPPRNGEIARHVKVRPNLDHYQCLVYQLPT